MKEPNNKIETKIEESVDGIIAIMKGTGAPLEPYKRDKLKTLLLQARQEAIEECIEAVGENKYCNHKIQVGKRKKKVKANLGDGNDFGVDCIKCEQNYGYNKAKQEIKQELNKLKD